MVQGLGYGRTGWGRLGSALEALTVVTFESRLRRKRRDSGPYTTSQLARDALAVLDEAEVERAHVLGISLGGMIAQELALEAPERVRKLVLCSTTAGGPAALPMPRADGRADGAGFATRSAGAHAAVRRERALARSAAELVDEIVAYRRQPARRRRLVRAGVAGAAHDAMDRLGEIRVPTLVIQGTADNVVDARNAQLLAERIRGARLELFEGVGHLLRGSGRRSSPHRRRVPRVNAAHARSLDSQHARGGRRIAWRSTTSVAR